MKTNSVVTGRGLRIAHVTLGASTICFIVSWIGLAVAAAPKEAATQGAESEARQAEDSNLPAIRANAAKFVEAFNKHDAAAVASLWTPEGEYVDEAGTRFVGRPAIEGLYAEFFTKYPASTLDVNVDSVRTVADVAVMEVGTTTVTMSPEGESSSSAYSALEVKVDGQWLLAAVRDHTPPASSAEEQLKDVAFLVGSWGSEEHGNQMESVCQWIADRKFIERRYTTTFVDGEKTSGVQIIGWNPELRTLQSWNFSPDGGHAIGLWSPAKGGWMAEMRGVAGDGSISSSVNLLRRLDDNAYVWQSVRRELNGVPIPDTGEVVLKRKPSTSTH